MGTASAICVTVAIPAYGRPDLLERTVRAAIAQDLAPDEFEVVVCDSSPDERNAQVVQALQAGARCRLVFVHKRAEGPGPSRNVAARSGSGPIIAFLDSDCAPDPGWLRAALKVFAADARLGLVQGRTIPDPSVPMRSLSRSVRVEAESPIYETANIFYRRAAFEQAGGFEADMTPDAPHPMGGEDTDLAWKVKHRGWGSCFAHDALVTHAVLPITPRQWLINRQCFVFPRIVARHPQLRGHFFARYFYDDVQAWLLLGLFGSAAVAISAWALLAWAPYVWRRAAEPTRAFGPVRLLRPLLYLPRDLCALALLVAGSIRFRALLL